MNQKYKVVFYGCRSGCCPPKDFYFETDDFTLARVAIARIFYRYRSDSMEQYYAVAVLSPELTKEQKDSIVQLADELHNFGKKLEQLKTLIRTFEREIISLEEAAKILEVEMPAQKQIEISRKQEELNFIRVVSLPNLLRESNSVANVNLKVLEVVKGYELEIDFHRELFSMDKNLD